MSELTFEGTLLEVLEVQSGTSKAGKAWYSVDFMLESFGQYPKQAAFNLYGDKIEYIKKFNIGDTLTVKFNLESRVFNGKVFTKATAYSVQCVQSTGNQTTGTPNNYQAVQTNNLPPTEYATQDPIVDDDELPF